MMWNVNDAAIRLQSSAFHMLCLSNYKAYLYQNQNNNQLQGRLLTAACNELHLLRGGVEACPTETVSMSMCRILSQLTLRAPSMDKTEIISKCGSTTDSVLSLSCVYMALKKSQST